jgi:hypothetical protein
MEELISKFVLVELASFTTQLVQISDTVRPRDTRPQAARTLHFHVFELGPKKNETNEYM